MGKGKKNKAKHAARKAAEKKKYITVEDVYEPKRSVEAVGGALGKAEESVEPAGEPEASSIFADEAETISEPAGESEGPIEPEVSIEVEDAFYGPSNRIGDFKEAVEPAGQAEEAVVLLDETVESNETAGEAEEIAGAIEEVAPAVEEPVEPADELEAPVEVAAAANEIADAVGEPPKPEGVAEETVVPADKAEDAEKRVADFAEVHHGAHDALKKEKDIVSEENRETAETVPTEAPKNEIAKKLSLPIVIGVAAAALVVGLLVGAFLLGGTGGSAIIGKSVVSEGELDSPIASYSYQGKNDSITVREVIEQSTSLEAAKDKDGNYRVPTADAALGVVRNKLLVAEAERQGITVADEDIVEYAATSFGTDDFEAIAASYQMDVDSVKALLREACLMAKLREAVAPAQVSAMPGSPTPPSSDDEDARAVPTKEYADYIIALAGDEWDAKKGTWASKDGPYASGLADAYEITAKGATYEAAMAAYYIAYQLYAQESAEADAEWAEYVNSILDNATIEVYTLLA